MVYNGVSAPQILLGYARPEYRQIILVMKALFVSAAVAITLSSQIYTVTYPCAGCSEGYRLTSV